MAKKTEPEEIEETEPEAAEPEPLVRWTMIEGQGEHVMKNSTTARCGAKGTVLDEIGTLPPDRRPPCQACFDKTTN